jgi:hypothetical protein
MWPQVWEGLRTPAVQQGEDWHASGSKTRMKAAPGWGISWLCHVSSSNAPTQKHHKPGFYPPFPFNRTSTCRTWDRSRQSFQENIASKTPPPSHGPQCHGFSTRNSTHQNYSSEVDNPPAGQKFNVSLGGVWLLIFILCIPDSNLVPSHKHLFVPFSVQPS